MSATIALPAVIDGIDGVHLPEVPPFTTLLLRTMNSLYRVVISSGPHVFVEGGAHLPTLTAASLDGVSRSGRCLTGGWIGVGVLLQIRTQDQWIVTTPVLAMAAEPSASHSVH
jgi:hypothetical protein